MDAIYFICSQTGIAKADLGAPFKRFSFFFLSQWSPFLGPQFSCQLHYPPSVIIKVNWSPKILHLHPPPPPQAINNDWSSVHFHYAPNTYSHCTKDSYRTYTICDVPLWRSVQHNFTPLQTKRQKKTLSPYWWTKPLRYGFLAGVNTIRYSVETALFCITRKGNAEMR